MAVKVPGSSSGLERASDVFQAPYTLGAWFALDDLADFYTLVELATVNNDPGVIQVFTEQTSGNLIFSRTGNQVGAGFAATAGRPLFLAVYDNGTDCGVHVMAAGGTLVSSNTQTSPGGTLVQAHIGLRTFFNISSMVGRISNTWVYDKTLNAAEVYAQAHSAQPLFGRPHLWAPCWRAGDVRDYSGNRRGWTELGTLGSAAPVMPLYPKARRIVVGGVVGGATPEGDLVVVGSGGVAAMAGTMNVPGALAVEGSGGAAAMPGTTNVVGALAVDGSGGTAAMVGGPINTGTLAADGSGGTPAMAGTPIASGALAVDGSGAAAAMAGTSTVAGTLVIAGSGATVAMSGETTPLAEGPLAIDGSGASLAMAGTSTVAGSLAVDGSGGAAAMAGTSTVAGSLAAAGSGGTPAMEGNGTTGDVAIAGSGAALAMEGQPVASGVCGVVSSGGAVAMAGTSNIPGELGAQGSGGTAAIAGTTNVPGSLASTGSGGSVSLLGDGAIPASSEDEWHPDFYQHGWIPDLYGEPP